MKKNDRINYAEAFAPAEDYELDYALATTYTLSLEALMFLPVSLFFGQEMEPEQRAVTNVLLNALHQVPDKVKVFCQAGKMKPPPFYHPVLAYWEESIVEVKMQAHNQSFHPKIWLARYVHKRDKQAAVQYRFLCTSRNLTLCRDWDVAVLLKGEVAGENNNKNEPLIRFVDHLKKQLRPNDKVAAEKLQGMMEELRRIDFSAGEEPLDYRLHPIGIDGLKNPLLQASKKQDQLLIVTPFLDKDTVKKHSQNTRQQTYLLAPRHELLRVFGQENAPANCKLYQFNPKLEQPLLAENDLPETATDQSDLEMDKQIMATTETKGTTFSGGTGLHAKFYVSETGKELSWYLGSANCTAPASGERNIEFLTELFPKTASSGSRKKATESPLPGVEETEKALCHDKKPLFIEYEPLAEQIEEADNAEDLRKLLFSLGKLEWRGEALRNADGKYTVNLSATGMVETHFDICIAPLSSPQKECYNIAGKQHPQLAFHGLDLTQVSRFLRCTISQNDVVLQELVILCAMTIPEERAGQILKHILNNETQLMRYLASLLVQEETHVLNWMTEEAEELAVAGPIDSRQGRQRFEAGLFEKLMLAAARNPKSIGMVEATAKQWAQLSAAADEKENTEETDFEKLITPFAQYAQQANQASN